MGLFNVFKGKGHNSRHHTIFGGFVKQFNGTARQLGEKLICLWKEYRKNNPHFDPNISNRYQAGLDYQNAFQWICLQLGYEEIWVNTFCNVGLRQQSLGSLAILLLTNDLMRDNSDLKKHAKAVRELHKCFLEILPDQVGELEDESRRWQSEL